MTQPSKPPAPTHAWDQARHDYLAGVSAPVVAERYGLSERSLRRRAAAEGWRRADVVTAAKGDQPYWNRGPLSPDEAMARFPELAEVNEARQTDGFFLLFDPKQCELRRFAFKKAAEAAALGHPQEAVVWMRLVQQLDRSGDRIQREAQPFEEQDYIRAAYLRRLGDDFGDHPDQADEA